MNKQFIFCALFICMTFTVSAATFTVNNNNPSPGQYTTIDAAMSAAANGDIILVSGSPTVYNCGAITKSLAIVGTGYLPLKDNPLESKVSFSGFSSAPNVNLKGLVITASPSISGANTTISGCYFSGASLSIYNVTGLSVRNNIFATSLYFAIYFVVQNSSTTPNIVFENNIFTAGAQLLNPNFANGVILRNNVFLANTASNLVSGSGGSSNPTNWTFQNNIFWNVVIATATPSSAFLNNISYSPEGNTNVPITNGGMNVGNINANPQFVNYSGGGYNSAHNYRLQAASLGHLAGTDGTDIGAYGGPTPRTDHGMPNIPVMKVMNITAGAVPVGGTIQVTFQSVIQN